MIEQTAISFKYKIFLWIMREYQALKFLGQTKNREDSCTDYFAHESSIFGLMDTNNRAVNYSQRITHRCSGSGGSNICNGGETGIIVRIYDPRRRITGITWQSSQHVV